MEIFNDFLFVDDYGLYINAICAKYIMHNHIVRHHILGRIQLQVVESRPHNKRQWKSFLVEITSSRNREEFFYYTK